MSDDHPACMACSSSAVQRLRVTPHSATRTLWDATPRDIFSCAKHVQAARQIGTVIAVEPLSDEVTVRTVHD